MPLNVLVNGMSVSQTTNFSAIVLKISSRLDENFIKKGIKNYRHGYANILINIICNEICNDISN